MMQETFPYPGDLEAVQAYIDGPAQDFFGMSYADGLQAMLDWITGNAPRPDVEEEE